MSKTNDPSTNRMSAKKLQAVIGHFTSVLISCGLLMWSVFNFWLNILAYRVNEKPDQAWIITAILVFVTCVLPFLLGLFLLFRALGKNDSGPRG